jgi:6-phosphogluconolactonase (cycloisomerase 2 family)
MNRSNRLVVCVGAALAASVAHAQSFQLVATETPPGSGSQQPVERFLVDGAGGDAQRLSDIPPDATDDPSCAVFRTPLQLFVSNRAAHSGNGSISVFDFHPSLQTFTQGPTITGNGLTDVAQITFNPVDGELFATNWTSGQLSRFLIDAGGNAVPNGTVVMPFGGYQLGVAVREADQQLLVTSYTALRRFGRNPDGTYSHIENIGLGSGGLHYLTFRGDELYIADVYGDTIYRYLFDQDGVPVPNGTVASRSPIAVAFSPDGREMFAASHLDGGITRFAHDPDGDAWIETDQIATPDLGGVTTAPAGVCSPDLNQDGLVNSQDFVLFLNTFVAGDPFADYNGDGTVNSQDFVAFLNAFVAGC